MTITELENLRNIKLEIRIIQKRLGNNTKKNKKGEETEKKLKEALNELRQNELKNERTVREWIENSDMDLTLREDVKDFYVNLIDIRALKYHNSNFKRDLRAFFYNCW